MIADAVVFGLVDAATYGEAASRVAAAEDLRLHVALRVLSVDQASHALDKLVETASYASEPEVAAALFWVVEELMTTYALLAPGLDEYPERFDGEPDLIAPFLRLVAAEGRRSWLDVVRPLMRHPDPSVASLARQVAAGLGHLG